ncbi:zf-TFIIB domain-containing protein [Mariniblastus sp.]|nr:zf-TFIIB domain-containing protein [Mariniblastus sp.]
MTLNCPTCDTSLTQRSVGGVTVDECVNCGGAWYDSSELSTILRTKRDQLSEVRSRADHPDAISCPHCKTKVISSIYAHDSGIPILKCSKCNGVWLTAGTLESIANYRNGPDKTDRLGQAIAETYVQSNRLNRFAELIQSRFLSLAFVVIIFIAVALFGDGGIGEILQLLAGVLFPLACIWFSGPLGRMTGIRMGLTRPAINQSTPAIAVAIGGWILMFAIVGMKLFNLVNR